MRAPPHIYDRIVWIVRTPFNLQRRRRLHMDGCMGEFSTLVWPAGAEYIFSRLWHEFRRTREPQAAEC